MMYDYPKTLGGHTMNFQNLQNHYQNLLSFLESNGYSEVYIARFRREINRILRNAPFKQWKSYKDVYQEYMDKSHSDSYLREKRNIIGALEQFDIHGLYPNRRRRNSLIPRGSYHLLTPEFQELIDFYRVSEQKRDKKATTINSEASNTASFLYAMQQRGCASLKMIAQEDVLSFFLSEDDDPKKSCSYRKNISAVLKSGKNLTTECQRILSLLPMLREKRKNIQYLTTEEVQCTRRTLDDLTNGLSLRDRAIGLLLLYTGLRSCDIAGLTLDSIDWKKERILIYQQKTEMPLELPLTAIIGNAIYDYLLKERVENDFKQIFLSETKPYTPLPSGSIGNIVSKIFRVANIRQSAGDRKGTHIFRHHLASSLLENGISQPVISSTLGHTSANSLEPYLKADFIHLKECAISIEHFPISEEVFCND